MRVAKKHPIVLFLIILFALPLAISIIFSLNLFKTFVTTTICITWALFIFIFCYAAKNDLLKGSTKPIDDSPLILSRDDIANSTSLNNPNNPVSPLNMTSPANISNHF